MAMALSERERRILEEIEDALVRDDPRLARKVSGVGAGKSHHPRGWVVAVVVVLTVVLLVLAVALA